MARGGSSAKAKQKQKQQKMILAGGTVVLVLVLAFELPKTMKLMHGGSSAAPAATTTTSASGATTTSASGTPGAPAASRASLNDTDLPIAGSPEKLVSFTRFSPKDPFVPQVRSELPAAAPSTSAPPPTKTRPPKAPKKPRPPLFGVVTTPGSSADGGGAGAAPKLPSATLRIDGKPARVSLGKAFPQADPVFRIAALAPTSIEIAVVRGSFADGSKTVTLRRKQSITLVNTVNGARFKLELVSTARAAS